jgi:hypothetical protein
MNAASDGRTYEEVSGEYIALSDEDKASDEGHGSPGCVRRSSWATPCAAAAVRRAFATMGTIAGIGAIVAFAGSAILLLLVALGLRHSRRAEANLLAGRSGARGAAA